MQTNNNNENLSIYEASEFWDEHDFGEFDDIKETNEIQFSLKKKKFLFNLTYFDIDNFR